MADWVPSRADTALRSASWGFITSFTKWSLVDESSLGTLLISPIKLDSKLAFSPGISLSATSALLILLKCDWIVSLECCNDSRKLPTALITFTDILSFIVRDGNEPALPINPSKTALADTTLLFNTVKSIGEFKALKLAFKSFILFVNNIIALLTAPVSYTHLTLPTILRV